MDLKALKKLRDDRAKLKASATEILNAVAARQGKDRAFTEEEKSRLAGIKAEQASLDELITEGEAQVEEARTEAAAAIAAAGDPAAPAAGAGQLLAMASAVERGAEPASRLLTMRAGQFAGFGDFLQGMAFTALSGVRKSGYAADPRFAAVMASTGRASTDVPSDGGLMVGLQYLAPLVGRVWGQGQILQRVTQQPVGDGFDGVSVPRPTEESRKRGKRWGGIDIFWSEDGSPVTTTKPDWKEDEVRVKSLRGLVRIPEKLLRDAAALGGHILNNFPKEYLYVIENAILRGDGKGKPLGVIKSPVKIKITKEAGPQLKTFVAENAMKMLARVLPSSLSSSVLAWFVNQEVLPQLWQMKLATGASSGQLVYMPPNGLSQSPFGTLFGRPVVPIEQCSALGDEGDVVLADFSEYMLVRKGGLAIAESMHFYFDTHDMAFRFEEELNGQPILEVPIIPDFGSAGVTYGPFITLENR